MENKVLFLVIILPITVSCLNISSRFYKSDIFPGESWSSLVYKTFTFPSPALTGIQCGAQCDFERQDCTAFVIQNATCSCHLAGAMQSNFLPPQPDDQKFSMTEGNIRTAMV